ncbi:hypothetical protein SIID45300_01344 [Candidatus Magnetaquicoccaceae bacterium FCR-1]|uniref:Tetratricopeptide repeat protein n=1 Tax=Candidatus Magnetaquiglobus chichijimensis TaxID=3141448 RepID=A0ABQ0C806_9PROT
MSLLLDTLDHASLPAPPPIASLALSGEACAGVPGASVEEAEFPERFLSSDLYLMPVGWLQSNLRVAPIPPHAWPETFANTPTHEPIRLSHATGGRGYVLHGILLASLLMASTITDEPQTGLHAKTSGQGHPEARAALTTACFTTPGTTAAPQSHRPVSAPTTTTARFPDPERFFADRRGDSMTPPVVPTQTTAATRPPVVPTQTTAATRPPVVPTQTTAATRPPVVPTQTTAATRPPVVPTQTTAATRPPVVPTQTAATSHPAEIPATASARIPKSLPVLSRMPEIGERGPFTAASLHARERIEEQTPSHEWTRSPARPARYLFLSNQPTPLNQARVALNKGENAKARRLYESVLRQEPGNPSALAGLAALAMREQREDRARQLYRELARLQPDSPIAMAGLNALDRSSDPETLESRLRALPAESPDIQPLQFVLGTRLAARDHWPAARDAFRAALRFDADNPDLHHNLAVALEHTGARQDALTHYREALRARAHRGWAGFDPNRIQRRIFTLQTSFPDA